ncbi:MAG: DUF4956 domain-containing protein [Oscillospiraceae bacterium]|nr:DUF4956 domain-containing protein [Oscillospiraceae bacterium]
MLNSVIANEITLASFLICIFSSIVLGVLASLVFNAGAHHSGSWAQSIAMLPSVVTLVIMLVNGNIGAGLAVAGTFAMVRFRSAVGSAKEITGLFYSVAIGLACGMGYVGFAAIFFVIIAVFEFCMKKSHFGDSGSRYRKLKITIPENMDYEGLFEDVFEKYTKHYELVKVKTTNMGTLFELSYDIQLKESVSGKQFIDDLRCRNGNLGIICSREVERELI